MEATDTKTDVKQDEPSFFQKNMGVLIFLICVGLVAGGAFLLYLFIAPIVVIETADSKYVLRPWIIWLLAGIVYIVLSFRWAKPIKADQIGVRTIFEKPTDQVGPGLPFVPLGIFDIIPLRNLTVQNEWPAEPEKVFRGDVKETPPDGYKPPIRITFREAVTEDEAKKLLGDYYELPAKDYETGDDIKWNFQPIAPDDGLARRVTAEVVAVTKYRIIDGVKFVQTVGGENQASQQIEDVVVSVLQRFLTLMSAGQALQNIEWISLMLHNAVKLRTQSWGIELEAPKGAFLKSINFHRDFNNAIAVPAEADFQAKGIIRKSQGEQARLENEGKGKASAAEALARAELVGRGEGLQQMMKTLKVSGAEALAAEVAMTFGKSGTTTIVDSKTGIAGLAGAASSLFQAKPATTPTDPSDSKKGGASP